MAAANNMAMEGEGASAEATEAERREKRVKARWSMLRQALLGNSAGGVGGSTTNNNNNHPKSVADSNGGRGGFNEHSMNAFPGFQVLERIIIPRKDNCNENGTQAESDENWNIVQNSYTSTKGHKVQFVTREVKEQNQVNLPQKSTIQSRVEALMSHRNYGVDNTGNVRVWDAEGTLAGFLLSVVLDEDDFGLEDDEKSKKLSNLREILRSKLKDSLGEDAASKKPRCNLLELGAGQAGLAGLAMASASDSTEITQLQVKPLHVILTDGHPKCVDNNDSCAQMTKHDIARAQVEAHLLLWDSSAKGAEACQQINNLVNNPSLLNTNGSIGDAGSYQLCLASDCVHFQDFHDGLLNTIARTLVVDGVALLCQPRRGNSLQNFMTLVNAVNAQCNDNHPSDATIPRKNSAEGPLFGMTLYEDFHAKVSDMHNSLMKQANSTNEEESLANAQNITAKSSLQYDPNWHRPLLLVLQKLRPYNEDTDGEQARQHIKMRVK